jgi:hypothetical protein
MPPRALLRAFSGMRTGAYARADVPACMHKHTTRQGWKRQGCAIAKLSAAGSNTCTASVRTIPAAGKRRHVQEVRRGQKCEAPTGAQPLLRVLLLLLLLLLLIVPGELHRASPS